MRIALGGLHIESCTFSPLLSREADFRILRGAGLLANYPFLGGAGDVTPVPLLYARALPGGPVEAGFYQRVKEEFLERLSASLPLDGLFLHMHGAVSVEGMEDAEGDFLQAVRRAAGPGCFLAASYDLHGNLSPRVMDALDLLSAYRTAPHIDAPETLARVWALLTRCLREGLRPHKAWVPVPVLLPGEKTSTEWEPAAGLYRQIPEVLSGSAVMDASILIGYVWADEPRSSGAAAAFGMDADQVRAAACTLAQRFWDVRGQFAFGVPAAGVDECIRAALDAPERPVVISDSGDNPTAGGAGDTPVVLGRLLALGAQDALVAGIADAEAVRRCEQAGEGSLVQLSLGGKLDPLHAAPLDVTARVRSLHILPWTLNRPGGEEVMNRIAVVEAGGILVVITERRTTFHRLADFTALGIDPHSYKIVVVKIGYLEPELKALAAKALLALSPGAVNQDITSIPYRKIHRPMYPFDADFDWTPPLPG